MASNHGNYKNLFQILPPILSTTYPHHSAMLGWTDKNLTKHRERFPFLMGRHKAPLFPGHS